MNKILADIGSLMSSGGILAPVLAIVAGAITAFTPCALSSLPLIIAYMGNKGNKKALNICIAYGVGIATAFIFLGVFVSGISKIFLLFGKYWLFLLGGLMIIMALDTAELIKVIPRSALQVQPTKKGYIGAYIMGILSGLLSSPCSTPVLVLMLGLVAQKGSIYYGIMLMLFYSIGYSILIIIAGTSTTWIRSMKSSNAYNKSYGYLKYVLATLMILLGLYLIYEGL